MRDDRDNGWTPERYRFPCPAGDHARTGDPEAPDRPPMRGLRGGEAGCADSARDNAERDRLTDEWGVSRRSPGKAVRRRSELPAQRLAYGDAPDSAARADFPSRAQDPARTLRPAGLLQELGQRIRAAVHEAVGQPRRKGPKGYRRSDERIREQVCEELAYSHGIDIRDVAVDVRDGVVILTGTVENRADKFEIEEIADNVFGVTDVDNRLKLDRRPTAIGS